MIFIKKAYQSPAEKDGYRILVDRFWPRKVAKDRLKIDLWLQKIAPSQDLRRWYAQEPDKWHEYRKKYKEELKEKKDLLLQIKEMELINKTITLVYSEGNNKSNKALIIKEVLDELD